ncbi:MAG: hypothetical protein V4561_06670 [Bacteroidota bacterium]|jgi:hypothetical protein
MKYLTKISKCLFLSFIFEVYNYETNNTMGKNKIKVYDALRAQAVKSSATRFNVSETYVRRCISSTDIGGQSEEIRRHFNLVYKNLQNVLSLMSKNE